MSVKTYNGSSWVESFKYYNNSTWEDLNVYTGDEWISTDALPFKSDISLLYNDVSENEFTNKKESNIAKFLPVTYKGNSSGHYTIPSSAMVFDDSNFTIEFGIKTNDLTTTQFVCGAFQNVSNRWYISISTSGTLNFYTEDTDVVKQIATNADLSANTYYVVKINVNRSTGNTVTFNDVATSGYAINDILTNFDNAATKQLGAYATNIIDSQLSYFKTTIGGSLDSYYSLPSIYDVSANEYHLTEVSITSANKSYDENGSLYLNQNGYSLWEHATLDPIQVPFDINGSALSLTAGVNIPSGYSKTLDIDSIANGWNIADCLVGFNEAESADSKLAIYDRSNATRQSAISRASDYYDDTNLATKSRYHITEIIDPRIYFEFFNVGYAGRIFGKVRWELISTTYYFTGYLEELTYATDKTGLDQYKIMKYCNIDVFTE